MYKHYYLLRFKAVVFDDSLTIVYLTEFMLILCIILRNFICNRLCKCTNCTYTYNNMLYFGLICKLEREPLFYNQYQKLLFLKKNHENKNPHASTEN